VDAREGLPDWKNVKTCTGRVVTGASTVTPKLQVALLPQASVATQLTLVVPTGKTLFEGDRRSRLARDRSCRQH